MTKTLKIGLLVLLLQSAPYAQPSVLNEAKNLYMEVAKPIKITVEIAVGVMMMRLLYVALVYLEGDVDNADDVVEPIFNTITHSKDDEDEEE